MKPFLKNVLLSIDEFNNALRCLEKHSMRIYFATNMFQAYILWEQLKKIQTATLDLLKRPRQEIEPL